MYFVIFNDEAHGLINEQFDSFDNAVEYWNDYADTPTCKSGVLFDDETNETIWSF